MRLPLAVITALILLLGLGHSHAQSIRLGQVVSKLGLRNRSGDTPRPRHATSYRAECLGFAKPARMATDVHACGLELSSEKIGNVVLLGGKTIQNFSSMNASGFWTLSGAFTGR